MRHSVFPTHIQSSWQSNWPKSNCTDQPCKPGCVHRNRSALHCSHISSASRHWNCIHDASVVRVIRVSSHFEEHRALRITQPATDKRLHVLFPLHLFFQLSWKQALPQPLDEPAEPSHLATMTGLSGIWEEHQLKKTRGLKKEVNTENSFFTPLNSAVPLAWL